MKAKITKRVVDAAVPQERDIFIWDSELTGFGLKITPSGAKIYIVQKKMHGRPRRFTIGRHGAPWTPHEARNEACKLLLKIVRGIDPREDRRRQAIASRREAFTMAQLCDLYLEEGCATKKQTTIATDIGRIERHIKPLLGSRRVIEIRRSDVERFMQDVAFGKTRAKVKTKVRGLANIRGGKGTAARTVGLLGGIFSFAVDRELCDVNPVRGVKRYPDRKCDRFLSPRELADLGQALSEADELGHCSPFAIAAIRLLVLTGCRRGEVISLLWKCVDFEFACLRLPDSKTGAKIVPLGAPALELLHKLPRFDHSPYVFPALRGNGHIVNIQKVWSHTRERAGLDGVRLHDLRHSFASMGAAGGDSLLIIGALLGHKTASSSERYVHLADNPLKAAADRISSRVAAALNGEGGENVTLANNGGKDEHTYPDKTRRNRRL